MSHPPDSEDRVRETVISTRRHDLRTPINAILGYSEMLLEDAEDDGNEAQATELAKVQRAGRALLESVDSIVDDASIGAGPLDVSTWKALSARLQRAMGEDLATVCTRCDGLLAEIDREDDEDAAADLERIRGSAVRLGELIAEVATLPEVEASASDPAPDSTQEPSPPSMVLGLEQTIRALDERRVQRAETPGHILVVDDKEPNRDLLSRRLEQEGHTCVTAANGQEALTAIAGDDFDLILLDILMPVMDGYQVLEQLKADETTAQIPVIVLSALNKTDNVVRCIELGADDFLAKPFEAVILRARIGACLERKRLRDREQSYLEELRVERDKSEGLLLNILPSTVADQLKSGESTIAETFPSVTVLFSDLVGFTRMSAGASAEDLVGRLNDLFRAFDTLADTHGVEKIKTIGDAYMVAAGLPTAQPDHAQRIADMALGMIEAVETYNRSAAEPIEVRVGMHSGPVVAGVIGFRKFAYDLWGDTVNAASRMESTSLPGRIQVSEATAELLKDTHTLERRGPVRVKGKGTMETHLLLGKRP